MGRFIARRLLQAIPLMFIVSVAAFSLQWLLPGDPAYAIAGVDATPEQAEALREKLKLDDPAVVRYGRWLGNALQGDFGKSLLTDQSVSAEIKRRFPATASIALGSFILAIIIGALMGIVQGAFAGRLPDKLLLLFVSLGLSTPNFWLATLLITYLGVQAGWFPVLGYHAFTDNPLKWLEFAFLPMLTLAVITWSETARQLRTGLVAVLDQEYIRAARARGLTNRTVVAKHALKNAALPTITVIGVRLGFLFAGSIIVEQIFTIRGLGDFAIRGIGSRDVPVIQAVVCLSSLVVLTIGAVVDILYAFLNPKVRVQ